MPGINDNTKLLLHFNGSDGSKAILDDSNSQHIITQLASAELTTDEKKFGSSSLFLDGNSDYLTAPSNTDFDFVDDLVSNRTISIFVKLSTPGSNRNGLLTHYEDANNSWSLVHREDSIGIRFEARTTASGTLIDIQTNTSITDSNWHQITMVKVADEIGIYLDGTQIGYGTISNVGSYNGTLFVGSINGGTYTNGYLDEVIIQKSDLYSASPNVGLTDTILVDTEEHTADTNTGLLLHMNSQDVSGDGGSGLYHIPSYRGTAELDTAFKKFGSSSLLLDGNSDYITFPDSPDWDILSSLTGNITVDCWVQFTNPTGSHSTIFSQRLNGSNYIIFRHRSDSIGFRFVSRIAGGSTFDIQTNVQVTDSDLHHVVIIKNDDEIGIYLDGTQIGFDTLTGSHIGTIDTNFIIGSQEGSSNFFYGHIDEFRLQYSNYFDTTPNVGLTDTFKVPTDEYSEITMPGIDANTKLMLHGNGVDGSFEILDDGNTGHITTQVATASLTTAQKKFGSASCFFDGNSDYLTMPDSPDWDICASNLDDWTIDFWVKHNTHNGTEVYIQQDEDTSNYWNISHQDGNGIAFNFISSAITNIQTTRSGEITDTNWHHISLCKVGNEYGVYNDGTQIGYVLSNETDTLAGVLNLGNDNITFGSYLDGNIDEARIQHSNAFSASPNVGLTDTIVVPTSEHTSDVNTKLLLHMNTQDVSGDGGSGSYHIPDFVGTAQIDTSQSKFGGASLLFDGNSDYLTIPDSADWDIGATTTEDFTIDFHIRPNAIGTDQWMFRHYEDNTNNFSCRLNANGTVDLYWRSGGTWHVLVTSTTALTDNNWHHIAIIKVANEWALYLNGIQETYTVNNATDTFSAIFIYFQNAGAGGQFYSGHADEIRWQKSNAFSATPNVGLTDTITVPTVEYTVVVLPDPPTSLTATTFDKNQIDLSWVAPIDPGDGTISGYKIERESPTGGGFTTLVADTGNTNLTHSDTSVLAGTQYNYRVSTITEIGIGNPSNEDDDTTDPGIAPVLSSLIISKNQIDLSWTAPEGYGTLTGYKIERESPTGGGFTTLVADTGNTNLTYSDTSVYEGTQFNYRVTGLADIDSDVSNESSKTTANIIDNETKLLLHGNGIDTSTDFIDSSSFDLSPTIVGNTQIDTAQSKFGGASIDFRRDDISDKRGLIYNDSTEFDVSGGDFTIESWIRVESDIGVKQQWIVSKWGASASEQSFYFHIDNNGTKDLLFRAERSGLSVQVGQNIALSWNHNQWYHVAVVRSGDTITTYRDGLEIDSKTFTGSIRNSASKILLGNHRTDLLTNFFDGWQDEFRFSKGIARFTTNFDPLSVEYASSPSVGGVEIKFDPVIGRLVKINTSKNIVIDLFTGESYRRIK